MFEALSLNTLLAAPTGRAAKRLSDLTGMEAKTIHRLLEAGFAPGGRTVYARTVTNPLECDAVILDEVSMVDIRLMQALIEALPHGARLVLVGDADQLPPVGPGNFLRDIIASQRVPTIQLTEIFRQAQKSDIVMNAHAVNEGHMPTPSGADGDFFFMKRGDAGLGHRDRRTALLTAPPGALRLFAVADSGAVPGQTAGQGHGCAQPPFAGGA